MLSYVARTNNIILNIDCKYSLLIFAAIKPITYKLLAELGHEGIQNIFVHFFPLRPPIRSYGISVNGPNLALGY